MSQKDKTRKLNEIWGLFFLLAGIFVLAALLYYQPADHSFFSSSPRRPIENPTGIFGATLAHNLILVFGTSSYCFAGFLILWAASFFLQKVPKRKWVKLGGFVFFLSSSAGLFAWAGSNSAKVHHGGLLGYFLDKQLEIYFGPVGSLIFLMSFFLLSVLLATEFLLFPVTATMARMLVQTAVCFWSAACWLVKASRVIAKGLWSAFRWISGLRERHGGSGKTARTERKEKKMSVPEKLPARKNGKSGKVSRDGKEDENEEDEEEEKAKGFKEDLEIKVKKYEPPQKKEAVEVKKPLPARGEVREKRAEKPLPAESSPAENLPEFVLPGIDLLEIREAKTRISDEDLKARAKVLEDTLREFEIDAKVTEIEQGPAITRYELIPAPGVKVASIHTLSDDLALAMKTASVRIFAPIPGKGTVGIEVPNSVMDTVSLRELLESEEYRSFRGRLPLFLGKDTSGTPLFSDLAEMPHVLIAGSTGSGKTVCVNAIIGCLLYKLGPEDLKFVMVDPKMVELAIYNELPHMLAPVVTEVRKAAVTLNWVVSEMETRFKILSRCGVRNIRDFNEREVDEKREAAAEGDVIIPRKLPFIVVVVDELADLMMTAQDKVEPAIIRLAQLSRAVGIHLILATQRPSVDVITGLIKANISARISFKVNSKVDSRTVLDMNGADKLLGKGDMLFLRPGEAKPIRGQGAFVTDKEIKKIVGFIGAQRQAQYSAELDQIQNPGPGIPIGEKDELYEDAVRMVLQTRQASTSFLQRRLQVGYGRAARLLDVMEQEGIIGPPQGTKPRQVLADSVANDS